MTLDDARRLALSLPEAAEEPHFDLTSFRVRKKIFATAPPSGEALHVFVDEHATRALVANDPVTYAELWWGKRLSGVRVSLATADPEAVLELLTESWLRRAPRLLAAQLAAHDPSRR